MDAFDFLHTIKEVVASEIHKLTLKRHYATYVEPTADDKTILVRMDGDSVGNLTPVVRACKPSIGQKVVVIADKTTWIATAVVGDVGGGPVGPQGPQGLKGDKGATGAQGPKGDPGQGSPSNATPKPIAATGAAGSSTFYSRDDHIHAAMASALTSDKVNKLKIGYATKSVSITSWTATGNGYYGQPSVSFSASELGLSTVLAAVTQKASGGAVFFAQQNAVGGGYPMCIGSQGAQTITFVCIALGT